MAGVLRIFLSKGGSARWSVLACVIVASLGEGFGLAMLLPLLQAAADESAQGSQLTQLVYGALAFLHLPSDLATLLLLVVVGMALKAGLMILAMRHVGYAVAQVATDLRTDLIDGVLNVQWPYFTRQRVGLIANAVSVDATRAGEAYRTATQFIALGLQTCVYVGISFLVSWELALVALGLGLVIAILLTPLVRMAKKAGRRQRQQTEELVTLMTDALGNIKPLKAMGRQQHLLRFVGRKIASIRKGLRKEAVSRQVMKSLQEFVLAVFIAGGFYVAKVHLAMAVSGMIAIAILMERTIRAINQFQQQLQKAVVMESAFWSVRGLIEDARGHRETWKGGERPTLDVGCGLQDVTFAYGDHVVLDQVTIEAPARSMTVITGASGAGKTTITDLLLGLQEPQEGDVLIDGVSLRRIDLAAWRSMVGYVPQELTLFHDSVLANVTLGDPAFTEDDARRALELAGAWEFVARLPRGLDTPVGERGSQLSGGQRQRIALARALVFQPRLLILDEVTSALDPRTEEAICRNILDLARERTVIAITHRPLWTQAADQIYHLGPEGARQVTAA